MLWGGLTIGKDMVPHFWIPKTLSMFGIVENINRLIQLSMENWESELVAVAHLRVNIKIKRGIVYHHFRLPLNSYHFQEKLKTRYGL